MGGFIIVVSFCCCWRAVGPGACVTLGVALNPFESKPGMDVAAKAAAETDAKARVIAVQTPKSALTLVKAGDLVIPVINQFGVQKRLFITARLVVSSAGAKSRVEAVIPRYVDKILGDPIPYFQKYFGDHDLVNIGIRKNKFKRDAMMTFGEGVSDVFKVTVFDSGISSSAGIRGHHGDE